MANLSPSVLAIVLAGGEGKRIMPLTKERAKPAIPFGGTHRLIDFPLSNLVNSGFCRIAVLTQYKSHSLNQHITQHWSMSTIIGNFITSVPAQQRTGKDWYLGSADAIYQNLNIIQDTNPDYIVIVGADHVYRMDFYQMLKEHIKNGADFSVAGIRQPISLAKEFGVINVDQENPNKIHSFVEKPENPQGLPDNENEVFASMGNYIASTPAFLEALEFDVNNENSKRDMGGDIVPYFVQKGSAFVYDFNANEIPGATDRNRGYWKDVGSIDAYYETNMDILSTDPVFSMYNEKWPIRTGYPPYAPAKFVHDEGGRVGFAVESLVSPGVIISGARIKHSVVSLGVKLHSYTTVEDSILLDNVEIGENCQIKNAIIDKGTKVGRNVLIGFDRQKDLNRGFTITDAGITVVPRRSNVTN